MARLDDKGTIQQVNRALCQILGMREGVLLGRTLESLTHPEDVGKDAAQRRDLLAGRRGRYEIEVRLVDANGGDVDACLSFSVARDEDGALRALLVQVQDMRERRQAERAREQLIREQVARAEAETAARRQDAIRRMTDAALAPLALEDLLRELLARITRSDMRKPRAATISLARQPAKHLSRYLGPVCGSRLAMVWRRDAKGM